MPVSILPCLPFPAIVFFIRSRSMVSKKKLVIICCLFGFGLQGLAAQDYPPGHPEAPGPGPQVSLIPRQVSDRAKAVMNALAAAYPDRIGPAEYRNGDWAAPLHGVYYYYAEGRLLPEALREQKGDYDPQPFYPYSSTLPVWKTPGPEESARMKGQAERRRLRPPKRSHHFYDALWEAHTKEEAAQRVTGIRFLGKKVVVHYAIKEKLALVEERIYADARTDVLVAQWIDDINTVSGWNWRSIADTQSRSFHAYGGAIDLLPKSRTLETYWLWTSQTNREWWTVPYEKRLHPPEAVIKAFESYGFVWGGKWLFYDTMHFEYRPEIFMVNNIAVAGFH